MIHCLQTESRLSYTESVADADRRMKAGQKQVYCCKCRLWVWPDQVAYEHKESTLNKRQFDDLARWRKGEP